MSAITRPHRLDLSGFYPFQVFLLNPERRPWDNVPWKDACGRIWRLLRSDISLSRLRGDEPLSVAQLAVLLGAQEMGAIHREWAHLQRIGATDELARVLQVVNWYINREEDRAQGQLWPSEVLLPAIGPCERLRDALPPIAAALHRVLQRKLARDIIKGYHRVLWEIYTPSGPEHTEGHHSTAPAAGPSAGSASESNIGLGARAQLRGNMTRRQMARYAL